MERQLVGQVAALGDADRVHLADEVRDRDVGRRELLGVPPVARQPVDRRDVAALGRRAPAPTALIGAYGSSLSSPPRTTGQPLVEQVDEQPGHAGLALAALAEEDDVLPGEDRVLDRGQDGLVVADDALEDRPAGRQAGDEVGPQLLLDGARSPARIAELADGGGEACGGGGRRANHGGDSGMREDRLGTAAWHAAPDASIAGARSPDELGGRGRRRRGGPRPGAPAHARARWGACRGASRARGGRPRRSDPSGPRSDPTSRGPPAAGAGRARPCRAIPGGRSARRGHEVPRPCPRARERGPVASARRRQSRSAARPVGPGPPRARHRAWRRRARSPAQGHGSRVVPAHRASPSRRRRRDHAPGARWSTGSRARIASRPTCRIHARARGASRARPPRAATRTPRPRPRARRPVASCGSEVDQCVEERIPRLTGRTGDDDGDPRADAAATRAPRARRRGPRSGRGRRSTVARGHRSVARGPARSSTQASATRCTPPAAGCAPSGT